MRICLHVLGRMQAGWQRAAVEQYRKQISRYAELCIREIPERSEAVPAERALLEEGRKVPAEIKSKDYLVVLDLQGDEMDSVTFARRMQRGLERGGSELHFVIGSSRGLSPELRGRAQERWAFGPLTFTHQLSRILLLEQIFRAFKILNHETYHK